MPAIVPAELAEKIRLQFALGTSAWADPPADVSQLLVVVPLDAAQTPA
jgi:hypothetical protein